MTRVGAKATLLALSLAATLGGWAVLAGRDRGATLTGNDPALSSAALSGPSAVQPPPAPAGRAIAAAAPTVTSPSASGVVNPPRAIARTRSSR